MTKSSFEPDHELRHTDDIGSSGEPVSFLTELLAALVLWLSASALGQFGVAVESSLPLPKAERTVARTPRAAARLDTAAPVIGLEDVARLARP